MKNLCFASFVFCLLFAVSCTNPFLVNPNTNEIGVSERTILPPKNVRATNGDFRKITLSWDSVQNAKQYRIYSASSPFDTFLQIGETSGNEAEFSLSVPAGKTLWFFVSAVSFGGEESVFSSYVQGSSVDIPNITDIVLGKDGTSATIRWWMGNCKSSTYKDSVSYKIICYEGDRTQVSEEKTASGSDSSVTFYNLKNKSVYYYQVVASVGEFSPETSDFYDAETARRTTPNPPENLECSKGTGKSSDGIILSWNLPEAVDIKVSGDNFEEHPLYFSLERKLSSETEDEYKVLVSYIGTCRKGSSSSSSSSSSSGSEPSSSGSSSESEIYFNCEKDAEFGNLKVSVQGTDKENAVANYPDYIAGAKLTYSDKDVEPGKRYTYRIRSYTDDAGSKIISSDSSVAESEGWLISNPSLELSPDYELSQDDSNAGQEKFSSITLAFSFDFEDFGLDSENFYKYILTSARRAFSSGSSESTGSSGTHSDSEVFVQAFDSVEEVNSFAKKYDSAFISGSENQGYYSFKIYICPNKNSEGENVQNSSKVPASESEYYSFALSSGDLTVTDDATKLPKIESFKVSDGFASKYILEWSYDSSYSYFLQWIEYDGLSGQPKSEEKHIIALNEKKTESGTGGTESENLFTVETDTENTEKKTAKFEHKAESGDARKYSLIAKKDLQTTKDAEDISMTLGTANASVNKLDYKNISVVWKEVQRAEKYSVEAHYADDSDKKNLVKGEIVYIKSDEPSPISENTSENPSETEKSNTTITEFSSAENKTYSCVISMPDGYSEAAKSGKEIVLSVKAENTKCSEDNTTTASVSARTFGPAELDVKSDGSFANNIKISWNEIEGAKGYKVFRIPYGDSQGTKTKDGNIEYFVNSDDSGSLTLERNGEKQLKEGSDVSKRLGRIYLNDVDDSDCLDDANFSQRELSLGLPFAYVVIPVLSGDDEFKFNVGGNDFGGGDSDGVLYSDIEKSSAFVKASTFGYGLNVSASKAESSKTVQVSWNRPFENQDVIPYIYRIENGKDASDSKNWERLGSLNVSATTYNDSLSGMDKTKSYYYAVQYNTSSCDLSCKKTYRKHLENFDVRYSDLDANAEELNKGYLLYFDFSADYNGTLGSDGEYEKDEYYYSEKVSHKPWDFTERGRGPSSFSISAKNLNTAAGYIKLADIQVDKTSLGGRGSGSEAYSVNADLSGILKGDKSGDTKLERSGSDLILSPVGLSKGTANSTDGILKVLRSAKTYYKIEARLLNTRKDLASGESESGETGEAAAKEAVFSDEVFGYRQISDEELVKAAMLNIAYAFYLENGGTEDLSGVESTRYEYEGNVEIYSPNPQEKSNNIAIFGSRSLLGISEAGKYKASVSMQDYAGNMLTPSSEYASFVSVSMSNVSTRTKGLSDSYLDKFRDKDFKVTVKIADTENKINKGAVLYVTCESDSSFTVKKDGVEIISANDKETRRKWFPIQIGDDKNYWLKSVDYGWWQE